MCSDFQFAAAVRLGEIFRACSPIEVRCWLISARAAFARSGCSVPHEATGMQSPVVARAGAALAEPGIATAATAAAATRALTTFPPMEPPEVTDSTG
jgi:hypothetical protein